MRSLDSNVLVALESDILVLAVKPAQFETVCEEIGEEIEQSDPLVVSVAAGLTLRQLADMLPARTRIARAMPNVNSSLREGMTAVCVNEHATSTDEASVVAAFEAVGQVAVLDESLFPHLLQLLAALLRLRSCLSMRSPVVLLPRACPKMWQPRLLHKQCVGQRRC